MSEPTPVDEFDHSDISEVGTDPGKKTIQADIDREAIVELGKRVTALEVRTAAVEQREAHEERLMRRLRKMLATWVGED